MRKWPESKVADMRKLGVIYPDGGFNLCSGGMEEAFDLMDDDNFNQDDPYLMARVAWVTVKVVEYVERPADGTPDA